MEKMPFKPEMESPETMATPTSATQTRAAAIPVTAGTSTDWRSGLPVMTGSNFTMRELRREDAPTLLAMLTTEEVSRFITPPPTTVEGYERFIAWTHRERL